MRNTKNNNYFKGRKKYVDQYYAHYDKTSFFLYYLLNEVANTKHLLTCSNCVDGGRYFGFGLNRENNKERGKSEEMDMSTQCFFFLLFIVSTIYSGNPFFL